MFKNILQNVKYFRMFINSYGLILWIVAKLNVIILIQQWSDYRIGLIFLVLDIIHFIFFLSYYFVRINFINWVSNLNFIFFLLYYYLNKGLLNSDIAIIPLFYQSLCIANIILNSFMGINKDHPLNILFLNFLNSKLTLHPTYVKFPSFFLVNIEKAF